MRGSLIAILLLAPAPAFASYLAPEGCPDEASFWSRVTARSAAARSSTASLDLRVVVTSTLGRVTGVLAIDDRPPAMRSVSGARCEEVVEALALITALAFERRKAAEPEPIAVIPLPEARPVAAPEKARFSAGIHGAFYSGVLPDPAIGPPIFFEVAAPDEGFTARVALFYTRRSASQLAITRFDWINTRLSACTPGLMFEQVSLRGCALADVGLLLGSAEGVQNPADSTRPWLALGFGARLRRALIGPVFFELEGGAVVPLLRDRFFFAPDRTVHQADSIVPFAEAGAGITF